MKNTLKLLGIALFGGILSTPVTLLAQNDFQSRQDQFLKRKIVRDRYDKTYKKPEKFLLPLHNCVTWASSRFSIFPGTGR